MPNIPNNWGTDLYKFVGKTFDINSNYWKQKRPILSLLGEVVTNSAFYDVATENDFPELPEYDGNMTKISPLRGFRTVIEPKEKFGSYDIHYKQWVNDQTGIAKKAGKNLSDSAMMTVYLAAMRMFQNAFDSNYKGADGKAWAATDHYVASKGTKAGSREYDPDTEAGTFSNYLASNTLTTSGIDAAMKLGARYVTPSGNPYLADYDLLLIAPELEPTAQKLLGKDAKLNPVANAAGSNEANPYCGMKYMVVGGGTAGFTEKQWAICDSAKLKDSALIVYNTKPQVKEAQNINPYIKTFVAYADFAVGFSDARSIIFSQGN